MSASWSCVWEVISPRMIVTQGEASELYTYPTCREDGYRTDPSYPFVAGGGLWRWQRAIVQINAAD